MSFKCFFNSHFVFVSQIHISFLQGSSFRFAVITQKMSAIAINVKNLFILKTGAKIRTFL